MRDRNYVNRSRFYSTGRNQIVAYRNNIRGRINHSNRKERYFDRHNHARLNMSSFNPKIGLDELVSVLSLLSIFNRGRAGRKI